MGSARHRLCQRAGARWRIRSGHGAGRPGRIQYPPGRHRRPSGPQLCRIVRKRSIKWLLAYDVLLPFLTVTVRLKGRRAIEVATRILSPGLQCQPSPPFTFAPTHLKPGMSSMRMRMTAILRFRVHTNSTISQWPPADPQGTGALPSLDDPVMGGSSKISRCPNPVTGEITGPLVRLPAHWTNVRCVVHLHGLISIELPVNYLLLFPPCPTQQPLKSPVDRSNDLCIGRMSPALSTFSGCSTMSPLVPISLAVPRCAFPPVERHLSQMRRLLIVVHRIRCPRRCGGCI